MALDAKSQAGIVLLAMLGACGRSDLDRHRGGRGGATGDAASLDGATGGGVSRADASPACEPPVSFGDAADRAPWSWKFGDPDEQRGEAIFAGADGSVYLAGEFLGAINIGAGLWQSDSSGDSFIAKLDPRGRHLWSRHFGSAGVRTAALSQAGTLVCAGSFYGTVDFGDGPVTADGSDAFLLTLDPCGRHLWSRRFGMAVSSGVYIDALAVAQDGSVMIAGTYFGPVDFGGGLLTAVASSDAQSFLAKYGPSGAHLWSRWVGPGARNLVLAVDAEGDTYVGGQLDGTIDLGAGPLTAPPRHARAWIAKLGPSGVPLWSLVTNGEERERDISATRVHAIAIDAGGNLVVNGTFIYTAVDFGEGVGVEYRCCGDNSFLTTIDAAGKPLWARWIGGYGVSANVDIGAGGLGLVLVTSSFQGFKVSHLDGSGFEQSSLTFARDTYLWVRGAAVDAWGAVLVTGAFRGTLDLGQGPMQTSALSDFDGYVAKLGP